MFYFSLTDWTRPAAGGSFMGLDNYRRLLHDDRFLIALRNTAIQVAISLPGVIIGGLVLGYVLSRRFRGFSLYRSVFFFPSVMSVAAIAVIFGGLFSPRGAINTLLDAVGLGAHTQAWLVQPSTALPIVIAVDFWFGLGFYAVLFSAALGDVPNELHDAGRVDGATEWQLLWRVGVPYIRGFIGVAAMLHFLWILLGSAQNVLLLTEGGPNNASLTLGYYMYQLSFRGSQIAYGQTVGVVLFVTGAVGALVIRRVLRRQF